MERITQVRVYSLNKKRSRQLSSLEVLGYNVTRVLEYCKSCNYVKMLKREVVVQGRVDHSSAGEIMNFMFLKLVVTDLISMLLKQSTLKHENRHMSEEKT